MTEYDRFVRAILDEPGDDTPRLVFADWLDDHGGPKGKARAELTRVQVEAARVATTEHDCDIDLPCTEATCPACLAAGHLDVLNRRAARILGQWGRAWLPQGARKAGEYRASAVEPVITVHPRTNPAFLEFARGWLASATVVVPEPHGPVGMATFLGQVLAANPFEELTVEVEGLMPVVGVRVEKSARGWRLVLKTSDGGPEREIATTEWFSDRRPVLQAIFPFLRSHLSEIGYTPIEVPF